MPDKPKVRLSDIAKRLNISTVSVSKAIAGKEGVSEELREKIVAVAGEMGYRMGRSSAKGSRSKTGNIGVVIPSRFIGPQASFYWILYNAVAQELLNRDYYGIMEILVYEDEYGPHPPKLLQDGKVDGIIILGQVDHGYIDMMSEIYRNFILLDFYDVKSNIDTVISDNFHDMFLLTSHLIERGHRDIRFVGSIASTSSIQDRYMGFLKAMILNGRPVTPGDVIPDRDQWGTYIELELPEKLPSAFVCNCDEVAVRLVNQLKKRGYSVPEDVSVVGYDNYWMAGPVEPAITTVEVDAQALARSAVDIIIKKINHHSYIRGRTLIGGKLVFKDSVRDLTPQA